MLTLGYGDVDLAAPVDWDHPDNAGLALWLLGLPDVGGGPVWPDLTGRTAGGTLANGAVWGGSGVYLTAGGRLAVPNWVAASNGGVGPCSVSVTFRPRTWPSGGSGYIGLIDSSPTDLRLFFTAGGAIEYVQFGSLNAPGMSSVVCPAGQVSVLSLSPVPTGVLSAFVNGQFVATTTLSPNTVVTSATLYLGQNSGNTNPDLDLYSVRIRRSALDAGAAARDCAWSLDPGTDERLRRLSSFVQVLGTGGGTSLAGDDDALIPAPLPALWAPRTFTDDEAAGALANFGTDAEDGWPGPTAVAVPRAPLVALVDDEAIPAPPQLGTEAETDWFRSLTVALPWLPRPAPVDDDVVPLLGIGQEDGWARPAVVTLPWVPYTFADDEASVPAAFGLDQEDGGPVPAVLAPPWSAAVALADEWWAPAPGPPGLYGEPAWLTGRDGSVVSLPGYAEG